MVLSHQGHRWPPIDRLLRLVLGLGLGCTTLSCAGLSFHHERLEMEPAPERVRVLVPGQANLQSCLDSLGAPTAVKTSDNGQFYVLSWAWDEQQDWGMFLSVPFGDASGASFNWSDEKRQPHYLRLFFDADWQLVDRAQG